MNHKHGRILLLIIVMAWAVRLTLAGAGGVMFYVDEWRYFTGVKVLNSFAEARWRDAAYYLVATGGHSGFAVASLPALLAQGLIRITTGLHPEDTNSGLAA